MKKVNIENYAIIARKNTNLKIDISEKERTLHIPNERYFTGESNIETVKTTVGVPIDLIVLN